MQSEGAADVELFVIGAGQMRTGTNSLQLALEHLYNAKCYHMVEVFKHSNHISLWQKCCDKRSINRDMANELFQGYVAAVDNPVSIFYRDLMDLYPNAKVILTVRDPDSWVKSVRQTTIGNTFRSKLVDFVFYLNGKTKMKFSLFNLAYHRTLEELKDDTILKECFIRYNEDVKKYVPKDRLLIFEAKQGWAPLCKFLDKDVPNIPYPKVNDAGEFQSRVNKIMIKSFLKYLIPILIIGVAFLYLIF